MESQTDAAALDTYRMTRKRFYEAANSVFGPGFLSMAEYYFMRRTGCNPFSMLFSEPRQVYDEWVLVFKGEEPVRTLFEAVAGAGYTILLEHVKRNDGLRVWDLLHKMPTAMPLTA
jgi:hypothetical protein